MASKTTLKFIDKGFRDILGASGTMNVVDKTCVDICARANGNVGHETAYYGAGHRWMGFVSTLDRETAIDEIENKTLVKAVRSL